MRGTEIPNQHSAAGPPLRSSRSSANHQRFYVILRTHRPSLSLLALILAAGAGAPSAVWGQSQAAPLPGDATVSPSVDFRSSGWLADRVVANTNGEEVARVSDLILDRGWGRIEYLVIKTGTTFGMGGRAIAIPYGAFRWESGKDRFVLASTIEQLKQFPEYTAESWTSLNDLSTKEASALRQRLGADSAASNDPYAGSLDAQRKARITGEVKSVDRVRTSTYGEQIQITVLESDGATRRISLGPSWYVNGAAAAPMRGDRVVVETLGLPRDPEMLLAGVELRNGERELRLRASDGTPMWALNTIEHSGRKYTTPYSRYLLVSQLAGMKVDCRGSESGRVHDVIIDRVSGEIGFLSIDPNQNFLGIGDTKRLLPWSVATVTVESVLRIDASKDMVLASPETPSEISTLNSGGQAERVYKAFGVPAPRFQAPVDIAAMPFDGENAWSARGAILSAIEQDSSRTLEGAVTDSTEMKFGGGIRPARALVIKTAGGAEETVLVGPEWYMANQKVSYKRGDTVKIDARRTTVDGRRLWIASSVECMNARTVLLDSQGVPAWGQR